MSASNHPKIRVLLRQHDDGLTAEELSEKTKVKLDTVCNALKDMPDTYIDRWELKERRYFVAVWCVIVPPENCPRPEK